MSIEILEGEIWKDVVGYEGLYMVSNLGRIFAHERIIVRKTKTGKPRPCIYKSKILKGGFSGDYLTITLCKEIQNSQLIHRIVANNFIENPLNKPCVNHKNGIKSDNRAENLEWVTESENNKHAVKTGLIKCGYDNKRSKPFRQYSLDGTFLKEWPSLLNMKKELGLNFSNIQSCFAGRKKTAYGYIWKRV
jgi:hypothetical protein